MSNAYFIAGKKLIEIIIIITEKFIEDFKLEEDHKYGIDIHLKINKIETM